MAESYETINHHDLCKILKVCWNLNIFNVQDTSIVNSTTNKEDESESTNGEDGQQSVTGKPSWQSSYGYSNGGLNLESEKEEEVNTKMWNLQLILDVKSTLLQEM